MFINQYLMALGEFDLANYKQDELEVGFKPYSEYLYLLFILSTFFTNIIILNMIIAAMGETFNMMLEIKDQVLIKNKLELLHTYSHLLYG